MPEEETKPSAINTEKELDSDALDRPKKLLTDYFPSSPLRKEMIEKIIQTDEVVRLLDEIISESPPDDYWCKMAEKKRVELEEALAENERLFKIKDALLQQNKYYKMMLEEANTFITVFKEVADDAADDTGIELEENDSSE
ncbi:geminin-like isoform X2 [Aricia agestis]|uniref:geminin-like isoform X2 n=1 Tax=Aricia agestis TaxID=91739 RepID=UPI001C205E1B|nr:geminin-like isoform X2 [Aricia agestis]